MKVLVSYDNTTPYTTGNYFLKAFGQAADAMHCLPHELKEVSPSEFDLYIKIDDGLEEHKWRPDLHPSVYYVIDSHIDKSGWREKTMEHGDFDHIFTAQKNALDKYSRFAETKWVPLGCDPIDHSPRAKAGKKEYDVCFIGNFHSEFADKRIDTIDRLFKEFPNFFYGNRYFQDMADKFKQSRVVFNQALNNDINMRYFEACCSGSFQLASRIHENGFDELYAEDEHLACYDSMDEMVDKMKYYLKNEKERERIARNGLEYTVAYHTYKNRAEKIIEYVSKSSPIFNLGA